jgi:Flp pilus assembly protein TadG
MSCTAFNGKPEKWQRGVALPLVAAGLLAMLAIVGLAVDASHALANKTRLQNTTDAAALAAAKVFDQTGDIFTANAAAMSLFDLNADATGNAELKNANDANEITVVIQWSDELNPFVSEGLGPYVRVIATDFELDSSISAVLGITDIGMSASAVAGPSPSIGSACNIAPMVACAKDPTDPSLFGFEIGQPEVLKSSAGGSDALGPGNFQLIRLDCGAGGDCVRENLAGSYGGCATSGAPITTEPGNTVGPVAQGLNTRFGDWSGPMGSFGSDVYPPDVVTSQPNPPLEIQEDKPSTSDVNEGDDPSTPDIIEEYVIVQVQDGETVIINQDNLPNYGWDQYSADVEAENFDWQPPVGVYERRVMALPIAACDGTCTGSCELPVIGFGCFFLLQEMPQSGAEANVFGQFVEGCNANGVPGPAPSAGPDPYLIQLYKDPDSGES